MGSAVIGTSRPEAKALITVIEKWTLDRLREVDLRPAVLSGNRTPPSSVHP